MDTAQLMGLARTFANVSQHESAERVTLLASRFVAADLEAVALHDDLPDFYHKQVGKARRWLRDRAHCPALAASLA